ncbi:MAG: GDSL-type esterase/lipase family protein [Acidobacteriaceae bacterium]|nr:GDSL-type esterase/lipase family protein [Acidobacteriaceae bacterium]
MQLKYEWILIAMLGVPALSCTARAQGDPPRVFNAATAAVRPAGTTVRVALIGDSTQTNHAGYGRGFCANLAPTVDCVNLSQGGASTKSYRVLGLWEKALQTKPDYMLIQFGHNDMQTKEPLDQEHRDRQVPIAQYEENLRNFVKEARSNDIQPVLVTPLTRLLFDAQGKVNSDLQVHADAMKRVASDMKVPLIDLHADGRSYLNKVGSTQGAALEVVRRNTDGNIVPDHTHLNWAGSYVFGRIVAEDLGKAVPDLKKYVLPSAAPLPPEGVKAMKIFQGAPVKIVLVGDSTVNAEGGWGKGFCAIVTANVTCINDAVNGRSSKSFIEEGRWDKALADKGDYYLIQFGHNDQPGKGPKLETDPETTYAANIRKYIRDTEGIGGTPVIVTPLSRRNYKDGTLVRDLTAYANAAKRVAAEEGVAMIDLYALSIQLLGGMNQEQADEFDAPSHADKQAENGKQQLDRTHLNAKGQAVFGRMVANRLVGMQVELVPDVIGETTLVQNSTSGVSK